MKPVATAPAPSVAFLPLLRRQPVAAVSALVLSVVALAALAAPLIEHTFGLDGSTVELAQRFAGPSAAHPLGTDELGRDLLARLLAGGRVSLAVGLAAALSSAALGTVIGASAGYFGGRLDAVLMRLTDAVIALPLLPLLIVLAALDLGKLGLSPAAAAAPETGLIRVVLIVTLVGWTTVARLVRSATLVLSAQPFILSARALGAGHLRIIVRHILPNLIPPLSVATTLTAGNVILLESVLSFLGLGVAPPMASWGNLLTNAQELIWSRPALALWPGLMIFLVVIALNLLGDGLSDAYDPRRR